MTPRYGRAEGGQRVHDAVPAGHWHTLTVLAALSLRGIRAAMTVEAPTDIGYTDQETALSNFQLHSRLLEQFFAITP